MNVVYHLSLLHHNPKVFLFFFCFRRRRIYVLIVQTSMETNNDYDAELLRAVSWVEHFLEQTGGVPGKNYIFNRVIYMYKHIK